MTDRELLDRIRAVGVELDRLVEEAGRNTKYRTRSILVRAAMLIAEADAGLQWHVED